MTIFFPDVSRYTPSVDVSKYPVVIAKATMADGTHGNIDEADPTYLGYKAAAAKAGTFFAAYHWLNHGNLKAQAAWCFQHVGPGIPVMIDAEDKAGNTGYNGPLTVADLTGFAAEFRALGGTVSLAYLPFWYWSGAMSMQDLSPLNTAGLHLVSSNYPNAGYTETGPGWASYGGATPVQWQYTSTPIDMNAFRGTVDDYRALVGGTMSQPIPGGYFDYLPDTALAILTGETPILGYPDATGPQWDNDALKNHNLKAVEGRLLDAIGKVAPAAPVDPAAVAAALTPEQIAAALTAAGITPEAVAAALSTHFHVS